MSDNRSLPADEPRPDDELSAESGNHPLAEDAVFAAADQATAATRADGPRDVEGQLAEANDRVLRAQAELENFRKRIRREMEVERRYAPLPLLRDLLGVVDNLRRAIEAAEQHGDSAGLLEGVKMVNQQLSGVLEQHHCCEIQAAGEPFDPNWHQAVAQEVSDEHPEGTVTQVTQTGYKLHDRVVRPSQVLVSSGATKR